jgi:general secretion pathway protein A
MIRLITNFEMDSRLVVSVILAGQPPLAAMLRREELEDVARRLAHIATLRTLSKDETLQYIQHRCTIAGAKTVPFDPQATEALFEISRGNIRAINRFALKALEVANDKDCKVVSSSHVIEGRRLVCP